MFARRPLARWEPYRVRPSSPEAPDSWETGTKDHEGLAGLVAAVEYLAGLGELDDPAPAERPLRERLIAGMAAVERHEAVLSQRFLAGLAGVLTSGCSGSPTPTASPSGLRPSPSGSASRTPRGGRGAWAGKGSSSGTGTTTRWPSWSGWASRTRVARPAPASATTTRWPTSTGCWTRSPGWPAASSREALSHSTS